MTEEFTVSEEMLICGFKYALGKYNYVAGNVVRDLRENAELLSSETRQLMIKAINDKWHVNGLGNKTDQAQWVGLLHYMQEVEKEQRLL